MKYNVYKKKRKIADITLTLGEYEHLKKSNYAKKKGLTLKKKKK